MNKTVENILVGGAVLLTSPIWIPVELVKGAKEYFIDSKTNKQKKKKEISSKSTQVNESNTKKEYSNKNNQVNESNSKEEEKMEKEKKNYETLELINSNKIKSLNLIYPKSILQNMESITKILDTNYFDTFQKNMKEEGLGTGYIALFYGAPGTGKTESVLQIAKNTGRPIYKVDIAEIQSMWIGETGWRVRGMFKKYKKYCKTALSQNLPIPILLINEADALLGKRHSFNSGSGPVSIQENNQVQNILLEEFETNEGIIFLTTNMSENLDGAFERRIFDKVKFDIPDKDTRKKIWKLNLSEIPEEKIDILARDFSFTGGDINIALRNIKKQKIINNKMPSFNEIYNICKTIKIIS